MEIKRIFRFDIDQTLTDPKDLVRVHMLFYNDALKLGMSSDEIMSAASTYKKTFDVPQIKEYRRTNELDFQKAREDVRASLKSNMEFAVNPGAVEGVEKLASVSPKRIGYDTVRPDVPGMLDATKKWLARNYFPQAEMTEICEDPADKIAKVLYDARENSLPVVLVDDNMKGDDGLLKTAASFPSRDLRKLTLVGYGINTQTAQSMREESGLNADVQVLGLESWQASLVEGLIGQLAA